MKKFEKIEFISTDFILTDKFEPLPAKKHVPEWFKNIEKNTTDDLTIKDCMPALDIITSGYLIRNTWHINLKQNNPIEYFPKTNKRKYISWMAASDQWEGTKPYVNMHTHSQCPVKFVENSPTDYFKIMNPWIVRTPPGYSCLIIPPSYHIQKGYTMLPAMVDTDTYDAPINFTGYLTDHQTTVNIMPGDPLIQIIPFKRDDWKMQIQEKNYHHSSIGLFLNGVTKIYRNLFHSKKRFD